MINKNIYQFNFNNQNKQTYFDENVDTHPAIKASSNK